MDDFDSFIAPYAAKAPGGQAPANTASAPSGQDFDSFIAPYVAKAPGGQAPVSQPVQASPSASPSPAPGLWPQVWSGLKTGLDTAGYIGKRVLHGALSGMATDENSNWTTPGVMAMSGMDQVPAPDVTKALGLNQPPPNAVARYGGDIGEAFGQSPLMAAAAPLATIGGAIGGDVGGLPGALAGGALGGGISSGLSALLPKPNVMEGLASQLGKSTSLQEAGNALRIGGQNHLDSALPILEDYAHAPVSQKMAGVPVPVDNYLDVLDSLHTPAQAGPLASSVKAIRSSLIDKLYQEAQGLRGGGQGTTPVPPTNPATAARTASPILPGQSAAQVPTWDQIKYFRSQLGDSMANPKSPLFSLSEDQKDAMYKSVTDDMTAAAEKNNAGPDFAKANEVSSGLRTHAERFAAPLVDPTKSPEEVANWALQGAKNGGTKLAALREVDPTAVDNLAASVLRTNPKSWLNMAKEAKEALVPDGNLRDQIDFSTARMFPSKSTQAIKSLEHLMVGSQVGAALGVLSNHLVPGMGELTGGAAGELLGLGMPLAGAVLRQPGTYLNPLIGGVSGGQNALAPGVK